MNRAVIAWDRIATLLVGLLFMGVGLAGILWWLGTFPGWPQQLQADQALGLADEAWWPWAVGAAGIVLILLGLRWLLAHVPDRRVASLKLPGSAGQGRLEAKVGPIGSAAADALALTPGVRSARGTVQRDRGQLVAKLRATVEPQADLNDVAAAADRVSAELRQVTQRDDLVCQVNLSVARTARELSRVD